MTSSPKISLTLQAELRRQLLRAGFGVALLLPLLAKCDPSPLADSPSPFVRAQAASQVRWHPWNDASLEAAKKSGKCVYVFIASPLSELARETISQTFTYEKTVAWLNENFYCIFVDGETQPAVAALGQHYLSAVKQLSEQPVHLWLTPDDLLPYEGANYLPPSEEWGKPGFLNTARMALDAWTQDSSRARALAAEAADMMRLAPLEPAAKVDIPGRLATATSAWVKAVDAVNGGFGDLPKQAEPEVIRFLLRCGGSEETNAAVQAARAAAKGALRDSQDGGFYRRCIDEAWKEPYPQKTFVDQVRIARALFEAAEAAKDPSLREAGVGALRFVLRELRQPDGRFLLALDGTGGGTHAPGVRPTFVRVGTARLAAVASFAVALHRSGVADLVKEAAALTKMAQQDFARPSGTERLFPGSGPADILALALALKTQGEETGAKALLDEAQRRYFDPATGNFMAVPVELPTGFGMRVPAWGDIPSAELLALEVGVDAQKSEALRHRLFLQMEYDAYPPGHLLLGLLDK